MNLGNCPPPDFVIEVANTSLTGTGCQKAIELPESSLQQHSAKISAITSYRSERVEAKILAFCQGFISSKANVVVVNACCQYQIQ